MKNCFFLVLFFCSLFSFSQENYSCGTSVSDEDAKRILEFVKKVRTKQISVTPEDSIVPIKFHVLGYTDSTGTIDSSAIFNELGIVNAYFNNAGIVFRHCGNIQYIYDDEYAHFEKIVDELICDENDVFNVLNIYFVPELYKVVDADTVNLCGYAYLSTITKNRLVMLNSCSTNGSTLAHEIGHYFSLLHTHSVSFGEELVNGTNCSVAGDLFCDTPADPKLSTSNVNQSCVYIGSEQDFLGDFYNPDVTNIMSYSRKHCRDYFSMEQLNQMNAYFNTYRNYLSCQYDGVINDLTEDFLYNIYPNPAEDQIAFSSNKEPLVPFEISIFDLNGKLVLQDQLSKNSYIDIGHLQCGTYVFKLTYGEIQKYKKFIKIKFQ